jgi:hypothetical protein
VNGSLNLSGFETVRLFAARLRRQLAGNNYTRTHGIDGIAIGLPLPRFTHHCKRRLSSLSFAPVGRLPVLSLHVLTELSRGRYVHVERTHSDDACGRQNVQPDLHVTSTPVCRAIESLRCAVDGRIEVASQTRAAGGYANKTTRRRQMTNLSFGGYRSVIRSLYRYQP